MVYLQLVRSGHLRIIMIHLLNNDNIWHCCKTINWSSRHIQKNVRWQSLHDITDVIMDLFVPNFDFKSIQIIAIMLFNVLRTGVFSLLRKETKNKWKVHGSLTWTRNNFQNSMCMLVSDKHLRYQLSSSIYRFNVLKYVFVSLQSRHGWVITCPVECGKNK